MDTLGVLDYVVIIVTFLISTLIGVYFASCGGRQKTSDEYFLGNRKMSFIPVSISLVVSVMSAIAYFGTPAEVYMKGPKYAFFPISRLLSCIFVVKIFLPVFYRMNITSVYEYLERRFNKFVRYSVIAAVFSHYFLYLGIVIYTPALALSTVTSLGLPVSILSVGVVCTFYTTVGGFKAVIWTDVFQALVMVTGFLVMIITGSVMSGGPLLGWQHAVYGQRSQLVDFNPDPTRVYTFWSILLGGTVLNLLIFGVNQPFIQRYISCKTEGQAKIAAWLGTIGTSFFDLLGVSMGMVLYSYYVYCDPYTSGKISSSDQILPYFIMDAFGSIPGLPGLLIAGAFCASLSSVSSLVNGLAAITGEDILKAIKKDITDSQYTFAIKIFSALYGIFGIIVAFLASVMGSVLATALSLGGMMHGPGLGVFCLGMLSPRTHSRGALVGFFAGVIVGLIFFIGKEVTGPIHDMPPLFTDGCVENITSSVLYTDIPVTPLTESSMPTTESFNVLALSFMYYSFVTCIVTVVLGYLFSIILSPSGDDEETVDPQTISPFLYDYFPSCIPKELRYYSPSEQHDDLKSEVLQE